MKRTSEPGINVNMRILAMMKEHAPKWQQDLMTKMEKRMRDDPAQRNAVILSKTMAFLLFHFIGVTELYVSLCYTIPFYYSDYGESMVYNLKVVAVFMFINTMANFHCVRLYDTAYQKNNDSPTLAKTLWEEYPDDLVSRKGCHGNKTLHSNGYSAYSNDCERKQLTWQYCRDCEEHVPPRSFHCRVCEQCILKRDHHCYMLGVCIGYYNQRYFVILAAYTAVACFWGLYLVWHYMKEYFIADSDWYVYFFPVTIYRWLCGTLEYHYMFMIFHFYFLWIGGMVGFAYFTWQIQVISQGKTSYEVYRQAPVKVTSTVSENFRSVFGPFWLVNFILPGQILFRQPGDGTEWERVQIDHHPRTLDIV